MQLQASDSTGVWHEQSAIWEIIAGELVLQSADPISGDQLALTARARERAVEATKLIGTGDRDWIGHALIGCTLALALAAREEMAIDVPIEQYAADLAAAISWKSAEPTPADIKDLVAELRGQALRGSPGGGPTLWELAMRCGAYAAGLSPYITRRRERRDILG